MSNTPFNQQITNALERPTSSGLNLGFANYDVQALAYSLMMQSGGTPASGFIGSSFLVTPASPASATQIVMSRGLGFYAGMSGPSNISSITGLNDAFDYKVVYTEARTLDVAPPCASGNVRRDLIMIKPKTSLTDVVSTDIYQPSVNSFASQNRYHTLSRDFTTETQHTLAAGVLPTADQNLVYKMGVEVPAASGYLGATIPSVDAGYMAVAVINVSDAVTTGVYDVTRLNDYRSMLFPNGAVTVMGQALIGSTPGLNPDVGAVLSDVVIKAPPGIQAAIYKSGGLTTMTYTLYIVAGDGLGFRANAALNVVKSGISGSNYALASFAAPLLYGSTLVTPALQTALWDPAQTLPAINLAVGQRIYAYKFSIGAPTYNAGIGIKWDNTQPAFAWYNGSEEYTATLEFSITLQK